MHPSFGLPQILNLRQGPRREGANRRSSNRTHLVPSVPMNMRGVQHFRLLVVLCKLLHNGLLHVATILPISIDPSTDEDHQCRLELALAIGPRVVKAVHDRRVIAIRQDLSTELFVQPVLLLVEEDDLQQRSFEGSLADEPSLCGEVRAESYLADAAGRNGYDDIVRLHLRPVFTPDEAVVLVLDNVRNIEVELDLTPLCLYLLSQVQTHMLSPQFSLLLLQTIFNIDNIIEVLRLVHIVKEVEETDLPELHAQDHPNSSLHHHFELREIKILVEPPLQGDGVPLVAQFAIPGIESRDLLGHPVDLPNAPLQVDQGKDVHFFGDVGSVGPDFVLKLYHLLALAVDRHELIFRLMGKLHHVMLGGADKLSPLIKGAIVDDDRLGPSAQIIICLEDSYPGIRLLFEDFVGGSQS